MCKCDRIWHDVVLRSLPQFQGAAKSKGLSMTVEAMLTDVYGAAKIVLTERGAVSAGCNTQSLGPALSV